jgi:hypothetical protein
VTGDWVYIVADRYRGTIYVGVTSDLAALVDRRDFRGQCLSSTADYLLTAPRARNSQSMKKSLVWLIPMVALAVALLELPYGYYVLLRLLVCGVCIYLATHDARGGRETWAWVLAGAAVVYNPIFRIHLNREIWSIVNVATIVLLVAHMWSVSRGNMRSIDQSHSNTGNSNGSGP